MRQIALQPRWADQMLCSQPSQCLTRMKVVTGVAHFLPQEWFVPNTRGEQGGTANFGLDWGGKTMTEFAMPGWSQPRSIIFLVPLLPSTAGLLLSWRLFETWKHVSNQASQTCIKFGIGISWSVWHISSHLAACWLDNLMVDLIESSGGASSCPEGLRSRFCKEGHITYITHSLARDPQVEFRVGVRRKVEENGTQIQTMRWNLNIEKFHGAAWVEALHCADFWLRLYHLTAWQHYPLLPSSQLMFDQTWGIRKNS